MPIEPLPIEGRVDWRRMAEPSSYATDVLLTAMPEGRIDHPADVFVFDSCPVLPNPTELSPDHTPGDASSPLILSTEKWISMLWPEVADQIARMVSAIYVVDSMKQEDPLSAELGWGCMCGHGWDQDPWTIYTQASNAGGMAEGWIHELGHLKLHTMGVHLERWSDQLLLNTTDELFESPVRKDKLRPMGAVLQAHYSYVHVVEWELRVFRSGMARPLEAIKTNRSRLIEGIEVVRHNINLTPAGLGFWHGLLSWTETLLAETEDFA